jgi:hypothetical protein
VKLIGLSQETPHLSWNPKVNCFVHESITGPYPKPVDRKTNSELNGSMHSSNFISS